jgi:hypothetical protein
MALGGGSKKWHAGHYIAGFVTVAVAAWAGVNFLPMVWTKVTGLFNKSA